MFFNLVLLYILLIPFQWALNPTENVDLIVGRVIIPLLFVAWLGKGLLRRKIILPWGFPFFFFVSFLISLFLSLLQAQNINWSIHKLLFLFSFFPLYFIISDLIINKKNKKEIVLKIIKAVVISGWLSALVGIFQFSGQFIFGLEKWLVQWQKIMLFFLGNNFGKSIAEYSSWLVNIKGETIFRAIAFFPDPHIAGFYWEITFFLALGIYYATRDKFYQYIAFIVLIAGILTFSRGAYLGLGITFLIMLIYYVTRYFRKRFALSSQKLLGVTVLFLIILFLFKPFQQRLLSSFDLREGSNSQRLENWEQAIETIKEHSWLGVGLGNYSLAVKPSAQYREPIYAHNLYLDIWAELGFLGIFSWLGIIFSSLWYSYQKFKQTNNLLFAYLLLALLAFSIHSVFESSLFSVHILPLLLILMSFN